MIIHLMVHMLHVCDSFAMLIQTKCMTCYDFIIICNLIESTLLPFWFLYNYELKMKIMYEFEFSMYLTFSCHSSIKFIYKMSMRKK